MNNLSYILYFAEALPMVASNIQLVLILAVFAYLAYATIFMILKADGTDSYARIYDKEKYKKWSDSYPVFSWWAAAVVIFLFLLTSLVPSKETIYLIAASEVGEVAVKSDVGKELLQDLSEILDHQLESLKGD